MGSDSWGIFVWLYFAGMLPACYGPYGMAGFTKTGQDFGYFHKILPCELLGILITIVL